MMTFLRKTKFYIDALERYARAGYAAPDLAASRALEAEEQRLAALASERAHERRIDAEVARALDAAPRTSQGRRSRVSRGMRDGSKWRQ
jgi:hypothetical protein